jgi:elongation factor Ts
VNCETDFVARTNEFKALVEQVTRAAADAPAGSSHESLAAPDGPVGQLVTAAIASTGENMAAPRSARLSGDYVGSYLHLGGKIGVVVALAGVPVAKRDNEDFRTFVNEVAMQVAAASPQFTARDEVPDELKEKERAIYRAQMEESGKPANVIDRIVEGKLGAYFEQIVLLDQASIRDPKVKVSKLVAEIGKALESPVAVAGFVRYKVGESADA